MFSLFNYWLKIAIVNFIQIFTGSKQRPISIYSKFHSNIYGINWYISSGKEAKEKIEIWLLWVEWDPITNYQ